MIYSPWLSTGQIREAFTEKVAAAGGTVSDTFDDGRRLFLRSVLPLVAEVRPKDKVDGGVALRANETVVCVHPYTFRQVCRNGAIVAQALETRRVSSDEYPDADEAIEVVREAVVACCSAEAFNTSIREMGTAAETQADWALMMLPHLARMPKEMAAQLVADVLDRFEKGRDRTQFGLMNAVTSLARDTRDPELRWRLEELGGAIPARRQPKAKRESATAEAVLVA